MRGFYLYVTPMHWTFVFLIPVLFTGLYWVATNICLALFLKRRPVSKTSQKESWPFVSLIKPVCGLEKGLYENLATALHQDYPRYEVIYTVQNANDPALPILRRIEREALSGQVQVVVDETTVGTNGRMSNLYLGSQRAKGEVLVFSDSDMVLKSNFLKAIVAPLKEKNVGSVSVLYQMSGAANFSQHLESLFFNVDFIPSMILAYMTGASLCTGGSQAVRKETLEEIGGLKGIANYFSEDYELVRRIHRKGYAIRLLPFTVPMTLDLQSVRSFWRHQVYWGQSIWAAAPLRYFFTFLVRGIPFASLYGLCGGLFWEPILLATVGLRYLTSLLNVGLLKDRANIRNLIFLPLLDFLELGVWFVSLVKRRTSWRNKEFYVENGMLVEAMPVASPNVVAVS